MSLHLTAAPATQADDFTLSTAAAQQAEAIFSRYPENQRASAMLPLLDLVQRENGGWLSKAALHFVAAQCGVAVIRVYEVASFYSLFYLEPVGRHVVQICRTTPCWLRGSEALTACAKRKLGLELGGHNADFTLLEVECLGACANAPMVQINDAYYEDLTPERFEALLDDLAQGNHPNEGSQSGRSASAPLGGTAVLQDFDASVNAGRGLAPFGSAD